MNSYENRGETLKVKLFDFAKLRNSLSGASLLPDTLALLFLLVWILQLYWTSSVADWAHFDVAVHLDLRNIWQLGESVALALWCAYFMLRPRTPGFVVMALAASLVFLGSLAAVIPFPADIDTIARTAGPFFSGIGCGSLMLGFCIRLSWGSRRTLLVCLALALAGAAFTDLVFYFLPRSVGMWIVPFLPLMSLGCLALSRNVDCAGSGSEDCEGNQEELDQWRAPMGRRTRMASVYVMLGFAAGLVYGMSQSFSVALGTAGYNDLSYILSIALTAPPIAVVAMCINRGSTAKVLAAVASVVLLSLAFGMLVMAPSFGAAAMVACVTGYTAVYFMIWALWGDLENYQQRLVSSAAGILALTASVPLGSFLARFVFEQSALSPWILSGVSMVAVYGLIMAAIMLLRYIPAHRRGAEGYRGEEAERCEDVHEKLPGDAECADQEQRTTMEVDLCQRYGLTARESEVFHLLAQGLNRLAIARELVISDDTVRTHMRNIYRKLDVHSQQQLIALVREGDCR